MTDQPIQPLQKIRDEERKVRAEVKERMIGYILAAFGLVAGLAWNDAIKSVIESVFPASAAGSLIAKFIYAILVTIFVAVFAYYISKLLKKE